MNLDVTSPAATMALALMFLKTNDPAVGSSFTVPQTHFALDYVRPDFILLRVFARGLVLWDSVQPTREWVQAQLPELFQVGAGSGCTWGMAVGPSAADAGAGCRDSCLSCFRRGQQAALLLRTQPAKFSLKLCAPGTAMGRLLALTLACVCHIAWDISVAQARQRTAAAGCCCLAASSGPTRGPMILGYRG